jgi:hypothetical protein
MADRRIINLLPNGILNPMPNLFTKGLQNDHRQDNGYSTETPYRDGHREVDQERTEAIIKMAFTKKRSTETLPHAKLRDAEICICNLGSDSRRGEACSYHCVYDHLL